jgi:hypothetical protein
MANKASNWKLSPSDFAFLWEECARCFYLKVARGFDRPRTPMPKMFTQIDGLLKGYYAGKPTATISCALPDGVVAFGERWVESAPISVPGHDSTCFIRGRFDSVVKFSDGSYGVIDFKTASSKDEHIPLYSRQLHAYAHALENPAPRKLGLSPVLKLGLVCVEPVDIVDIEDAAPAYKTELVWIECARDDQAFLEFLGEVLDVLDLPDPPGGTASCPWCQHRDTARRICV